MSFVQQKRANVFDLLAGAFRELSEIRKELAIYFVIFAALLLFPTRWIGLGSSLVSSLVLFLGYFVAQYWLYQAMLRKAGMLQDGKWRIVEFFVMALVLIVPISIGLNLFVIPGLILIAKWIMAPTYLVAQKRNLIQAIGESWSASSENSVALTLAATVICVIWGLSFGLAAALIGLADVMDVVAGDDLFWLWVYFLPVLLAGLSMSAYRQLSDETASLTEVFA
ncbi:hypothetical protein [Aurantiacibacter sp. D1-12]|uniref:hypothetical protein n=1 Tax=Aurantiacibacter sp. D1-12 TaxID=2993658 RepID=UPI00237C9B62|nr:hypothetical protein [Aurantiacibacter sp. D1-12]MDE1466502.1 hypothetical protein [Aurantiacibacter sp. D1-12]